MKIVFFGHPQFLNHQSMPRFAKMLAGGMAKRGHDVELWYPSPKIASFSRKPSIKKYLGYIDQFFLFPSQAKRRIKKLEKNGSVLFVLTDQALGPWMSFIADKPHVIHCHDFIAQKAAVGAWQDFKIGISGKWYQHFIKKGYSKGKNFISVSKHTQEDLHQFLQKTPLFSEVIYNGLNRNFSANYDILNTRKILSDKIGLDLQDGFLLHVGGNEWYKNRKGVIAIYDAWRKLTSKKLPLLLIGKQPDSELKKAKNNSTFNKDIHFLINKDDDFVVQAYASASLLLFPSKAEGFGWPIAEAMACGCPVLTTYAPPMTEVGLEAAFYLPKFSEAIDLDIWTVAAAQKIEDILNFSKAKRAKVKAKGIQNVARFETEKTLDAIEKRYIAILAKTYENTTCSR